MGSTTGLGRGKSPYAQIAVVRQNSDASTDDEKDELDLELGEEKNDIEVSFIEKGIKNLLPTFEYEFIPGKYIRTGQFGQTHLNQKCIVLTKEDIVWNRVIIKNNELQLIRNRDTRQKEASLVILCIINSN